MTNTATLFVQHASEAHQLEAGRERYFKQQDRLEKDKGFGGRDSSNKLVAGCLPLVSEVIQKHLKGIEESLETKTKFFLNQLDPDLLSLIALNGCLLWVRTQGTLNRVVTSLGKMVEGELWAKVLKENNVELYVRLVQRATTTHGSVKYRKRALRAVAAKEGFQSLNWPQDLRANVGAALLAAVMEACGDIFETYLDWGDSTKEAPMSNRRIGFTTEGAKLLDNLTEPQTWMYPMFKPMLMKPRPWVAFNTGAYLTDELRYNVPLVRTFDQDHIRAVQTAIDAGGMDQVLGALNAIQETPWAINGPLLDLIQWAWDTNQAIDGFPVKQHLPRPKVPTDWETLSDDRKKAWRINASQIATRNRGVDGDRVTMFQDLSVAQSLTNVDRFYLPHSLDFRGRVYPVPAFNTQRADHIRAMFKFATALPLGDGGAYWLAIHTANTGDFDGISKRSLTDRFAWVVDNEEIITNVAKDPKGTIKFWSLADKPFQFVAACMEYAGFLEFGGDYCSSLPIALDGSNSGLQHYAASLRSNEGILVNLLPSDSPADLYQTVADEVLTEIKVESTENQLAKIVFDQGITRKLVKRNAMTFSYSSGEYGFKQQHMTDLMRPLALKVLSGELPAHPYGDDGGFRAAGYIAKKVYKVISSLVKDATTGMKFFQDCAKALAHEGKGLQWTTPLGLPVSHRYTDFDSKLVKLFLHDKNIPVIEATSEDKIDGDTVIKKVRLNIRTTPSKRINKTKAKSAVSPNVIHSMDASHLMLTVLKAKAGGIEHFSLIHDSFGTHAANTSEFFYIIREAFVSMYENYCPYEEIYSSTIKSLKDKTRVPTVPKKGLLDVRSVFSSLYAFA